MQKKGFQDRAKLTDGPDHVGIKSCHPTNTEDVGRVGHSSQRPSRRLSTSKSEDVYAMTVKGVIELGSDYIRATNAPEDVYEMTVKGVIEPKAIILEPEMLSKMSMQ